MTNEEKRLVGLTRLSPKDVMKKLEVRFKQSLENANIKEISKSLEKEINEQIAEDEVIFIYHVSHQLSRYGVPHFRSYDKTKFNGITVVFIAKNDGTLSRIYASFCDKEDTYSRSFGRLKVLTRIQKDLENMKNGITSSKFSPVILDSKEALKYLNPMDGNVTHQSIVRGAIDWFITNHVNKPKKKAQVVNFTRQQVLKAEQATVKRAERELNNTADLRLVYEHESSNPGISRKVPRLLCYVDCSSKSLPRDTTTAKLILANTERNRALPKEVSETLTEILNDSQAKVYRHKDDQPNRVNSRMFAIRKMNKILF